MYRCDVFHPQAQQLPAPITSALKLQSNQHSLYLIKDETSNGYLVTSLLHFSRPVEHLKIILSEVVAF